MKFARYGVHEDQHSRRQMAPLRCKAMDLALHRDVRTLIEQGGAAAIEEAVNMKHANNSRALLVCALIFASAVQAAGLVGPTDTDLQKEVDQILQQHPDAVQISEHEIAWGEGEVILDLRVPASVTAQAQAMPQSCRAGYYCFYDEVGFNGRKLSFSPCPSSGYTQVFADYAWPLGVKSWAVNRTVNRIDVKNADGALLWRERSHTAARRASSGPQADRFTCYN